MKSKTKNGTKGGKATKVNRVTKKLSPIARGSTRTSVAPQIVQRSDKVVIKHVEVINEAVVASAPYSLDSMYAMQPGISAYSHGSPLFSWLPPVANKYDKYRLLACKLHYRTLAPTTAPGMIAISYDPNPDNPGPESYTQLRNSFSKDGNVHDDMVFDVTPRLPKQTLLTRSTGVSQYPLYDAGRIFVASIGGTGVTVGILEVEYTIELTQPQGTYAATPFVDPKVQVTQVINGLGAQSTQTIATDGGFFLNTMQPATGYGPTLATFEVAAVPTYTNTLQSAVYKYVAGNRTVLKFARLGRYRLSLRFNIDINDLKCANLKWFETTAGVTQLTSVAYGNVDGTVSIYTDNNRGFRVRGTADGAVAGTEPDSVYEVDVVCTSLATAFTVCVGSDPVDAATTWSSVALTGQPVLTITYFGEYQP